MPHSNKISSIIPENSPVDFAKWPALKLIDLSDNAISSWPDVMQLGHSSMYMRHDSSIHVPCLIHTDLSTNAIRLWTDVLHYKFVGWSIKSQIRGLMDYITNSWTDMLQRGHSPIYMRQDSFIYELIHIRSMTHSFHFRDVCMHYVWHVWFVWLIFYITNSWTDMLQRDRSPINIRQERSMTHSFHIRDVCMRYVWYEFLPPPP